MQSRLSKCSHEMNSALLAVELVLPASAPATQGRTPPLLSQLANAHTAQSELAHEQAELAAVMHALRAHMTANLPQPSQDAQAETDLQADAIAGNVPSRTRSCMRLRCLSATRAFASPVPPSQKRRVCRWSAIARHGACGAACRRRWWLAASGRGTSESEAPWRSCARGTRCAWSRNGCLQQCVAAWTHLRCACV